MKNTLIFILLATGLFSEEQTLHLFTTEVVRYDYTATSLSLKDAELSYDLPAVSYMMMNKNYIVLASLKYSKKQSIGSTALGVTNIGIEQECWKYEIGAGYKFYLTESFFVGPALLVSDTYTKLYQTTSTSSTKTEQHDNDLRFYGIFGYQATKSTTFLGAIELDNDLLSNDYLYDYSQYQLSITMYQFLSKSFFLYLKYEQSLRDKEATTNSSGNRNYRGYGFGIGIKI